MAQEAQQIDAQHEQSSDFSEGDQFSFVEQTVDASKCVFTINIGGPKEVWEKMMERRPRPFYHDWFAASFHHEFTFGGDLESAYDRG